MTKPANIESIEKGTGKSWDEWLEFFTRVGAEKLNHPDIAKKAYEQLEATNDNAGWWAQGVTVAYEQYIGRRVPGQVADGTFEVAATKTLDGSKEDVMVKFVDRHAELVELHGITVESTRSSGTDKRLYWKADLADGTQTIVACEGKPGDKSMISATQIKIASKDAADEWREFWKAQLAELG